MNGGTTFTCTIYEHSVTTFDFKSANGNRRTQAAAEINPCRLGAFAGVKDYIVVPEGYGPFEQEARS